MPTSVKTKRLLRTKIIPISASESFIGRRRAVRASINRVPGPDCQIQILSLVSKTPDDLSPTVGAGQPHEKCLIRVLEAFRILTILAPTTVAREKAVILQILKQNAASHTPSFENFRTMSSA